MSASPTVVAAPAAAPSSPDAARRAGLFGMKPLTPVAPTTRTALGIAFFEKGQFTIAEAILKRAVESLGATEGAPAVSASH